MFWFGFSFHVVYYKLTSSNIFHLKGFFKVFISHQCLTWNKKKLEMRLVYCYSTKLIYICFVIITIPTEKIAAQDRRCQGLPLLVAPPKICDKQIDCDRHCKTLKFVRGTCKIPKRASTKVCICYRDSLNDCKEQPRWRELRIWPSSI